MLRFAVITHNGGNNKPAGLPQAIADSIKSQNFPDIIAITEQEGRRSLKESFTQQLYEAIKDNYDGFHLIEYKTYTKGKGMQRSALLVKKGVTVENVRKFNVRDSKNNNKGLQHILFEVTKDGEKRSASFTGAHLDSWSEDDRFFQEMENERIKGEHDIDLQAMDSNDRNNFETELSPVKSEQTVMQKHLSYTAYYSQDCRTTYYKDNKKLETILDENQEDKNRKGKAKYGLLDFSCCKVNQDRVEMPEKSSVQTEIYHYPQKGEKYNKQKFVDKDGARINWVEGDNNVSKNPDHDTIVNYFGFQFIDKESQNQLRNKINKKIDSIFFVLSGEDFTISKDLKDKFDKFNKEAFGEEGKHNFQYKELNTFLFHMRLHLIWIGHFDKYFKQEKVQDYSDSQDLLDKWWELYQSGVELLISNDIKQKDLLQKKFANDLENFEKSYKKCVKRYNKKRKRSQYYLYYWLPPFGRSLATNGKLYRPDKRLSRSVEEFCADPCAMPEQKQHADHWWHSNSLFFTMAAGPLLVVPILAKLSIIVFPALLVTIGWPLVIIGGAITLSIVCYHVYQKVNDYCHKRRGNNGPKIRLPLLNSPYVKPELNKDFNGDKDCNGKIDNLDIVKPEPKILADNHAAMDLNESNQQVSYSNGITGFKTAVNAPQT